MKVWRLAPAAAGVLAAALGLAPASAAGPPGHSYRQAYLRQVESRMEHSAAWQHQVRGRIGMFGIDTANDRVQVGLSKITPRDRSLARRLFGGALQLVIGGPVVLPSPRLGRMIPPAKGRAGGRHIAGTGGVRDNDTPPFYGGGQIVSVTPDKKKPGFFWYVWCTSGFDAFNPSANWNVMLTAGHCDVGGSFTKWYSGYANDSGFTLNAFEGDMDKYEFSNGNPDVGIITKHTLGTYDPRVFYGQLTWQESHEVVGTKSPTVGDKVCVDGATTGVATCGAEILHTGYTLYISEKDAITGKTYTYHIPSLFIMKTTACHPGDSGGPIYYENPSGTVLAAGTVDASQDGTNYCIGNEINKALDAVGSRIVVNTTVGGRRA